MISQHDLFHDSILDAIGADVAAAGGFKKVATRLWPSMEPTLAAQKLRSCLNADHSQKLDIEELLLIKALAKETGSQATISYEAQQLGFAVTWLEPDDERSSLDRRIADGIESLNKLLGHRERKFGPLAVAK